MAIAEPSEVVLEQALSEYEQKRGKPMPSRNHSAVQLRLGALLMFKYDDRYTFLSELTLDLDPPLIPDICAYPKLSIDWSSDEIRVAQLPILAIEIQSPTQGPQELIDKIKRYLAAGVQSCWLVQPSLRLIAVYTSAENPQIFTEGEVKDPVTGINIAIEDIFQ